MTNSYYACIYIYYILFHTRMLNFTCVYTRGLMPHVFFAFAHACDTHGLFKLWAICTVRTYIHILLNSGIMI